MNPELFKEELAKHNFDLTDQQMDQFAKYYAKLIQANEHVNLTRITEQKDVYLKHFYDSATALLEAGQFFQPASKVCDVGAGAGFPSIPLKILRPDLELTIVDSLAKRLTFLQELVDELGLDQVHLVHARAEDAGQNPAFREQFDVVTARAVARMQVLSEYCLPLVAKNGYFVALKGPKAGEELADAKKAIQVLGGTSELVKEFTLPVADEQRTILVVKKVKPTPNKYPRQAGLPNKSPIK